ncbi:hypothetical protein QYE76_043915 [Lolium multiflorum]|uniref:DUF4218 domain-containing protein n=1 Tax=Lolium multiflorum TaxID=4521 RepID=A0AAD8TJN7_LOLMU|nr:hypothetical protein QYE76_043915 [Lolium multiflorum]
MVHLLVHVVDDIIHLGPTFVHNMMPFERLNCVIKGFVRNRARPDGSIAKGFLTYECISFCQNYLSTENEDVSLPTRKHVGRLAGFGHREGYRSMHVGIAGRHADFDRAHRVALQHIELTDVKERFYGKIEEIWELDYVGETMPMFRVRWAKSVEKDGLYFTTMVIPDAKRKTPSAKNEPWVLASQVDQCFFITDPSKPSRVVVRRGKRSIIGMEGEADKQDIDKNGDPKIKEEFDKYFDKPTTYSKHTSSLPQLIAAPRPPCSTASPRPLLNRLAASPRPLLNRLNRLAALASQEEERFPPAS